MFKTKWLAIPLFVFIVTFSVVGTASAIPMLPSSFYGQIHISDGAPSAGDAVNAFVDGTPAANTLIFTDGGQFVYRINIPGDDTASPEGHPVTFKIGGRIVGTGTWQTGTNVSLNFHPPEALPGAAYSGTAGSPIAFAGSANDWGTDADTYEWDWDNNGTYDETGRELSHTWASPGDYTVALRVTDVQGGIGTATVSVHVAPASATVTLNGLDQTYYGTARVVTATTEPPGLTVVITYEGGSAPINVGDYAVSGTISDPNYTGSATGTLHVAKAASTTTVSGGGSYIYNGSAHTASVTVTRVGDPDLHPTPVYSGACSAAPVNVADTPCAISYTYPGDSNHLGSTDSDTITITTSPVTVILHDLAATYDGAAKAASATTVPPGHTVAITYDGSLTAPTNAASYAVVATVTDVNFAGSTSGTLVIAKANAAVTLVGLSQTYTGTARVVTATTVPAALTVDISYQGGSAPINAGDYTVSGTVNNPNYVGTASGTLHVAQATSTTNVSGGSFVYDGNPHAATVTVTRVGDPDLHPAPVYSCGSAPVNVVDTPCTASYTYAGDPNHSGSSNSAIITITPNTITVTANAASKVFGDGDPALTYTSSDSGVAFSGTLSRVSGEGVGTYAITQGSLLAGSNYSISFVPANFTIYAVHQLALVPGWNLVSFNVHPLSTLTGDVLASISGHFDMVYAWDATGAHSGSGNWLSYNTAYPELASLNNLSETMGFWIHMTSAATLRVVGTLPTNTSIALSDNASGWNLVAYPSATNRDLPGVLSDHLTGTGNYSLVYSHRPLDTSDPWKLYDRTGPAWANDLSQFTPGWGYWVMVTGDPTWSVDYAAP